MPGAVAPLDPSDCGPAFLALPQDIQAEAYDFPAVFFEPRVHYIRRPAPDPRDIDAAAAVLREASKPMIISGGGVHYSDAVEQRNRFQFARVHDPHSPGYPPTWAPRRHGSRGRSGEAHGGSNRYGDDAACRRGGCTNPRE